MSWSWYLLTDSTSLQRKEKDKNAVCTRLNWHFCWCGFNAGVGFIMPFFMLEQITKILSQIARFLGRNRTLWLRMWVPTGFSCCRFGSWVIKGVRVGTFNTLYPALLHKPKPEPDKITVVKSHVQSLLHQKNKNPAIHPTMNLPFSFVGFFYKGCCFQSLDRVFRERAGSPLKIRLHWANKVSFNGALDLFIPWPLL